MSNTSFTIILVFNICQQGWGHHVVHSSEGSYIIKSVVPLNMKKSRRPGVLWRNWKVGDSRDSLCSFSVGRVTSLSHFIWRFLWRKPLSMLCHWMKLPQNLDIGPRLHNGSSNRTGHIGELISLPSKGPNFTPLVYKKKRWPGQRHSGFSANCKMWTDFSRFL